MKVYQVKGFNRSWPVILIVERCSIRASLSERYDIFVDGNRIKKMQEEDTWYSLLEKEIQRTEQELEELEDSKIEEEYQSLIKKIKYPFQKLSK